MFKPGSIRKIEVTNFVTYSYVEFFPGPKLNMIIGPNGTGKSTIVAAIILGLGGNPKIVGRGNKVSEYVKHNCETAIINLHLQDEDDKFVKVTREFNLRDKTTWKLNNKVVTVNDVMQFIEKFNIQVNNLCQFLPQDRVQDFAKLNKQDLLRETLKALCRFDLIEKQTQLINTKDQYTNLQQIQLKCQNQLKENLNLNSRLEVRVESFNKMKEYSEKIRDIERKIAWISYEEKREELKEVKNDKIKAQECYDKHKNKMKPMEQKITDSKQKTVEFQQQNTRSLQLITNFENSIKRNLEKFENTQNSLNSIEGNMQAKLAVIEQWNKDSEAISTKLVDMKKAKAEAEDEYKKSLPLNESYRNEMTKLSETQKKFKNQGEVLLQKKQDYGLRIRALENESKRLENIKQSRLELLRKMNSHAYEAVQWLQNNKHLFKGEIYEPIMLEVNVLDKKHSKFVENVIPLRDKIAFTCIYKEDMNTFIKYLRGEKKLSINVVCSNNTDPSHYKPTVPIEHLRKFGFYAYINNLITAPAAIMNYLCKSCQIHNIPVGDQNTDNNYEIVPIEIRLFFSEEYRYQVSISPYSKEKTISQIKIRSDGSLSLSLDIVKKNQLQGQIEEIQRKITDCDRQNEAVEKQYNALAEKLIQVRTQLKEIEVKRQNAQAINSRIEQLQQKLHQMRQIQKSPDDVRKQCKKEAKQKLQNIFNILNLIKQEQSKLINEEKNHSLRWKKIQHIRESIAHMENEIIETKRLCQEAEETLKRISDKYSELMEEAKNMLLKAKSLSNGFTPADKGFNEFRDKYEALSSEIEELQVQRKQLQSRAACLDIADDGEMQEYEQRLRDIEMLTKTLEKHDVNLNQITMKMKTALEEWLEPLRVLLDEINTNFSNALSMLQCAGEISLSAEDNENDFSQYGISIKVTYRSGEPLQELNSNVQSGGEKAVATAVYMLSLQKLTPVPFRCVDEINQGMDATNERKIFQLIVDTTCHDSSSQYFMVTPKLIPNLKYSPDMTIHIVHNGPFINPDRKWGFSVGCNPKKLRIN